MEPLSFIAAILGAGGLGVILKLVLNFARASQAQANQTLEAQRNSFERFMNASTRAVEENTRALERFGRTVSSEHRELRDLMRSHEEEARHRRARREGNER